MGVETRPVFRGRKRGKDQQHSPRKDQRPKAATGVEDWEKVGTHGDLRSGAMRPHLQWRAHAPHRAKLEPVLEK